MTLAQFITANTKRIISEWEEFARLHVAVARKMDARQRRDHVEGLLKRIVTDLETPQTKAEQASKATGNDDEGVTSNTAANDHGTDRAATGFSPTDVVSEFRALRANILRMWSAEPRSQLSRDDLEEVTRFNEAIDQLLVESMTRYAYDVEYSKDLFLGVLSHDLRNPLGAIMMSATVMMTREGPGWPHHKTAARILTAGTRMDALIGDLVDFTRARMGSGIPLEHSEVDLGSICQQTVDEITALHPRCVVNLDATGDLHGRWDVGRIGQALSNLCGNAIQHGAENTPIDVTVRGEGDHVVVAIHNEGHRIPESRLHDIFNPFKQLDPARKPTDARSVGLGLFIVQSIVKAHEGTIDVESNERGTTFTVRLPRTPTATPATNA